MLFKFSCSSTNYFVYYLGFPAKLHFLFNSDIKFLNTNFALGKVTIQVLT